MAYATDIITQALEKTKGLFFPIDKKYWLKLGFVNMLGANQAGNYTGGSGGSGSEMPLTGIREAVRDFNSKALVFLAQYGHIIGIILVFLYLLSLLFTYLGSMFTFVFFDGLADKHFSIKKSLKKTKKQSNSLFMFRLVLGLISLVSLGAILWPLISAFMNNILADFNLWNLVPMSIGFIFFAIMIGLFSFITNDFLIPIMYLKKYGIFEAWNYFKKIASGKKMEIFIYLLMKIVLGMAFGIITLVLALALLIPGILAILFFGVFGVLMFLGLKLINEMLAIGITAIYVTVLFMLLIYVLNVLFVPFPAFFRIYSIEMVKKLEKH